jgi:hypothetical protein
MSRELPDRDGDRYNPAPDGLGGPLCAAPLQRPRVLWVRYISKCQRCRTCQGSITCAAAWLCVDFERNILGGLGLVRNVLANPALRNYAACRTADSAKVVRGDGRG